MCPALSQHCADLVSLELMSTLSFVEIDFEEKSRNVLPGTLPLVVHALLHFIPLVRRSVVEICQHMSRYSGPKFLLGDFNSIPYSEEMAYLRGEIPLQGTYCRDLTDVWRESPQYRNVATKPSDRAGFTFSAIEENAVKRVSICYCMV